MRYSHLCPIAAGLFAAGSWLHQTMRLGTAPTTSAKRMFHYHRTWRCSMPCADSLACRQPLGHVWHLAQHLSLPQACLYDAQLPLWAHVLYLAHPGCPGYPGLQQSAGVKSYHSQGLNALCLAKGDLQARWPSEHCFGTGGLASEKPGASLSYNPRLQKPPSWWL